MIKIIIDQYNEWLKSPEHYLNPEIYKNGYSPYWPPLQINANLNLVDDDIFNKIEKCICVNENGLIEYDNTIMTDLDTKIFSTLSNGVEKKVFSVGLEPQKSKTFEKSLKRLYPDYNSTNRKNKVYAKNVNILEYLKIQLDHFNTNKEYITKGFWPKMRHFVSGYTDLKENILENGVIHIDLIPMHSKGHKGPICDKSISLFESKIQKLGVKKIFFNGKGAYKAFLKHKKLETINEIDLGKMIIHISKLKENNVTLLGFHQLGSRYNNIKHIDIKEIGAKIKHLKLD